MLKLGALSVTALLLLVCVGPLAAAPGNLLVNPGLEYGDLSGWTTYGCIVTPQVNYADPIFDGIFTSGQFGIPGHDGSGYTAGSVGSWQAKDGGMYQRMQVIPGESYGAKAWIYTWAYDAGGMAQPRNCDVRIGLDPAGGTDRESRSIIWAPGRWPPPLGDPEIYFSQPELSWTQIPYGTLADPWDSSVVWPLTVTATGPVMTVFVELWQWYDWEWTITVVDDIEVVGEPPGPPGVYIYNITETALSSTSQRIEFETQVPAIGRIDWGLTTGYGFSQQDTTPSLHHSFDLSGVACNTTYHYKLTATAPHYDTGDTGDRLLEGGIPVAISNIDIDAVSPTSMTISWTTDLSSDSLVEYGLTTAYGSQVSDPALTTSHSVTLTDLTPNTWYHYRITCDPGFVTCRKTGVTADDVFLTPPMSTQNLIVNGSFEDGVSPWVLYAYSFQPEFGDPGLPHLQCTPWPDWGIPEAYDGSCFLGNDAGWETKWGGAYQIVGDLVPGQEYLLTAWHKTWASPEDQGPYNCENRLGVDLTGGTDPGAGSVQWGAYDYTPNADPWEVMTLTFTATGSQATIFLETMQRYNIVHVNAFDGVTLVSTAPGAETVSSPAGAVVAGWNLISLPLDPLDTDPASVFAGISIEGQLYRWVPDEKRYAAYLSANPGDFGEAQAGVGYWLYADGPETIAYNGYYRSGPAGPNLPVGGWHLVGCPQTSAKTLAACSLYNNGSALTKSYPDAAASNWIADPLYWYDQTSGSYSGAGLDDWDADNSLRPWRGYWMHTAAGSNLDLIVPN
jgi:hypothetical protein